MIGSMNSYQQWAAAAGGTCYWQTFLYSGESGTLASMAVYVDCDAGGADSLVLVIKTGGGADIAVSQPIALSAGTGKGWYAATMLASAVLTQGAYYGLGFTPTGNHIGFGTDSAGKILVYGVVSLGNHPPDAPTITSPGTGSTVIATQALRVYHTYGDQDGGSQSASALRWSVSGAASWTTISNNSPVSQVDIPAGTLTAGGAYDVQVRTYDDAGLVGPWSSTTVLNAVAPPAGPTITDPIVGQAITGDTYDVVWSIADQVSAEARRVANNAGSPNTGTVYETVTVASASLRMATLNFNVNGRVEHVQVRREYPAGVWSSWSSVAVTVSKTPPETPVCLVVNDATNRRIRISATHPTPGGGIPAVASMDVYRNNVDPLAPTVFRRIAKDLVPGATWDDYWVRAYPSIYAYVVRAVAATGASADSTAVY